MEEGTSPPFFFLSSECPPPPLPRFSQAPLFSCSQEELDVEEDAEDAIARIARAAKEMEDAQLRRRHLPIQRGLPRPFALNVGMGKQKEEDDVKELLREEMVKMIRYDAHKHPISNKKKKGKQKVPYLLQFEDDELKQVQTPPNPPFFLRAPFWPV